MTVGDINNNTYNVNISTVDSNGTVTPITANGSYPTTAGVALLHEVGDIDVYGTFGGATVTLEVLGLLGTSQWMTIAGGTWTSAESRDIIISRGRTIRATVSSASGTTSLYIQIRYRKQNVVTS